MIETLPRNRIIAKLTAHIPPAQFRRYLLVGVCNTVFGYATYAAFTALLTPHLPHAYIVASLVAGVLNITEAFLTYKWIVFKTRGNYLREWMKCIVVYSGGTLIGVLLLPIFVFTLRHLTRVDSSAPYIAGAALTGLNIIAGFLGHKNFSFANNGSVRH
jgi:putative flippase GtrA